MICLVRIDKNNYLIQFILFILKTIILKNYYSLNILIISEANYFKFMIF